MAEDNRSEQEVEQAQGEEAVQEPAEEAKNEPDEKNSGKDGLLLPILYAFLAAVGAFTLVMIAGIVWTVLTQPAEPLESPSTEQSAQVTQAQAPEGEGSNIDDAP